MKNDIWALTRPAAVDAEPSEARSPLLDAKVMMVDDEPLMTDLIQTHLEEEGYTNFVVANDPRQALELLRREDPGVLLLDLLMPGMSGFQVLEAIRADRSLRYTPVIVLTAATGADAKLRALQLGATDFLSKPVDASELVLRVRNTLAFRQYHDRLLNYDLVTGLANQRLFDRTLAQALQRRDLVGGLLAVFSITVPECRELREGLSQAAADTLATALARRLDRFANDQAEATPHTGHDRSGRVARQGGERFALLLEGLANADEAEEAARHLDGLVSDAVSLGVHDVAATAWIGIALSPGDGDTPETLRKSADLAATHGHAEGARHYTFASAGLNARSLERLTLASQLRGAAQRGELRLHYQPKVDLQSNRIVGAEALVRWQHPQHGLVPPARFIALAEEMGLIEGIGEWVIDRACHDAAAWAQAGGSAIKVAVNVAKPQFTSGNLCRLLRQALFDSGLPARLLVVELTESMLMDDMQASLEQMEAMKALGLTLSIDDFGTGYSSLSYLKRFPLDELKIDRSFVIDLPGQTADTAIVSTVIGLGHSLGMTVIAEGVETLAQLACLKQLGCDSFQGFLYSRPVPAERLTEMLDRERTR
jgi:EAL domain-containing protein (putative c-di-GMP-specific phosphodiesterase class I)/PleD family two-component response regulator